MQSHIPVHSRRPSVATACHNQERRDKRRSRALWRQEEENAPRDGGGAEEPISSCSPRFAPQAPPPSPLCITFPRPPHLCKYLQIQIGIILKFYSLVQTYTVWCSTVTYSKPPCNPHTHTHFAFSDSTHTHTYTDNTQIFKDSSLSIYCSNGAAWTISGTFWSSFLTKTAPCFFFFSLLQDLPWFKWDESFSKRYSERPECQCLCANSHKLLIDACLLS